VKEKGHTMETWTIKTERRSTQSKVARRYPAPSGEKLDTKSPRPTNVEAYGRGLGSAVNVYELMMMMSVSMYN